MKKITLLPLLIIIGLVFAIRLFSTNNSFPQITSGTYVGYYGNPGDNSNQIILVAEGGVLEFFIVDDQKVSFFVTGDISRNGQVDSAILLAKREEDKFKLSGQEKQQKTIIGDIYSYEQERSFSLLLKPVALTGSVEELGIKAKFEAIQSEDILRKNHEILKEKNQELKDTIKNLSDLITDPSDLRKKTDSKKTAISSDLDNLRTELQAEQKELRELLPTINTYLSINQNSKFAKTSRELMRIEGEVFLNKLGKLDMKSFQKREKIYSSNEITNLKSDIKEERDLIYIYEHRLNKQANQ